KQLRDPIRLGISDFEFVSDFDIRISDLRLQSPRFAHRPAEHAVGFVLVDEAFLARVPAQRAVGAAAQADGDVADVADADRAMPDADVADRLLAAAHADDE